MKDRLSVSVPSDLIPKLKELAKQEKRNLSNLVAVLLEEAVENKKAA